MVQNLKRAWTFGNGRDAVYVESDGSNKSKYAVVEGLECNDPRKLKIMTLMEARIKACKMAKANPKNGYNRIGIFKEDKHHISGTHFMPKLVEYVMYDGRAFFLLKWDSTHKMYRVSPTTGKLLDYSREFRYI